jgi:hypothetical protein
MALNVSSTTPRTQSTPSQPEHNRLNDVDRSMFRNSYSEPRDTFKPMPVFFSAPQKLDPIEHEQPSLIEKVKSWISSLLG